MRLGECLSRKRWDLRFTAEPEEVSAVRRLLRIQLSLWGLPDLVEPAQLCASELVTNVIDHVGAGTPVTLTGSMRGTRMRLELRDRGSGMLPNVAQPDPEAEGGRGLLLVSASAADWGVALHGDSKTTWVEFETGLASPDGHIGGDRVTTAEALLILYRQQDLRTLRAASRLSILTAEDVAISLIADVLSWLRAHGCDPDEVLDRAQSRFDGETSHQLTT